MLMFFYLVFEYLNLFNLNVKNISFISMLIFQLIICSIIVYTIWTNFQVFLGFGFSLILNFKFAKLYMTALYFQLFCNTLIENQ